MLRNLVVTFFLCAVVWFQLKAQVATVTDERGQPLEMVTFGSISPNAFATSDGRGQVDISPFVGAEKIVIRMLGFETDSVSYRSLKESPSIKLKTVGLSLDQVVVSATRWNQSKKDVAGRISTLSAREVRLQNPQTAADMIGATGEVFIQKSQLGGGSPMIRGFATNRLLIAVDGVRMNTAIFRSGNVQNIINLDAFSVENSEVFFGPGSVIYGSDAIGGVMNFQTFEPILSHENKTQVSGNGVFRFASASNELTGHVDLNFGWKKFATLTSVTYTDFSDLTMGKHGPDEYLRPFFVERQDTLDTIVENKNPLKQTPTGYSQLNIMQKFRYSPNKKWNINYGFHYSKTSSYARYDRYLREEAGFPRYAQWDYGPQLWMLNVLDILHSNETVIYSQINIRLAHQLFEESRISRNFQDDTRTTQSEMVHAYSLNLDFRKYLDKKHQFFYGIEGIINDVFSDGREEDIRTGVEQNSASRYPRSNWSSAGAYLTYKYRPIKKVTLQGGIRYNHFVLNADFDTTFYPLPFTEASINNGAVTGSLGVVYNPIEKWAISINASTGFRSPNVDDVGKVFDSQPGSVVIPNPNLKSEYAYNGEIGIAKVFGKWLKIDVTAFYTYLQNALIRRDFTLNGIDSIVYDGQLSQVQAIQNAARAYVYGVQAGVEIKLPRGFALLSRFNYQKGAEELPDGTLSPLRHAGPWFGTTHFTFTRNKLKLDLCAIYNGQVTNDNLATEEQEKNYLYASNEDGLPYSPSWYTLNFKAIYQFDKHLQVSTGIENITNQRYRTYSSGLTAPGINFILSVRGIF
jgi:hemoglobin/transferrin/lactoferrin receptor protein